jgi:hypothetical protein
MGNLHEDLCKCIISGGVILVMINVSGKIVEKIKANILLPVNIFSSENRSV